MRSSRFEDSTSFPQRHIDVGHMLERIGRDDEVKLAVGIGQAHEVF